MKILSIINFTTKLLSDLYIGVHLKGTKKFGSNIINRQFFHMKILFITNFTTKLLSIKDYLLFKWTPIERPLKSLVRSLIVKLLLDNIFIERLGLKGKYFLLCIYNSFQTL